jgi:hypothetical protein
MQNLKEVNAMDTNLRSLITMIGVTKILDLKSVVLAQKYKMRNIFGNVRNVNVVYAVHA